jgi:hypothetical protein
MPPYTCLCCGHIKTFETADDAFEAGWDIAPYFTLQRSILNRFCRKRLPNSKLDSTAQHSQRSRAPDPTADTPLPYCDTCTRALNGRHNTPPSTNDGDRAKVLRTIHLAHV